MLRIKLFILSAVAAFAVSAVAAAGATAAEYFVEGKAVTTAVPFEGASGVSKLKTKLLGEELVITCKKDALSGDLEAAGASSGEIDFEECGAGNSKEPFSSCEVPTIKSKIVDQLITHEGTIEDEVKPATGETFVEIVLKNKGERTCLLKGSYPVKGTQTCKLPNGETSKVEHKIECRPTGSNLTFNDEPATYEGTEKIKLDSGKEFNV